MKTLLSRASSLSPDKEGKGDWFCRDRSRPVGQPRGGAVTTRGRAVLFVIPAKAGMTVVVNSKRGGLSKTLSRGRESRSSNCSVGTGLRACPGKEQPRRAGQPQRVVPTEPSRFTQSLVGGSLLPPTHQPSHKTLGFCYSPSRGEWFYSFLSAGNAVQRRILHPWYPSTNVVVRRCNFYLNRSVSCPLGVWVPSY